MNQKPLKVAVIGPKGQCGSCVVDELLSRGHQVTGISRSPPKDLNHEGSGTYTSVAADLNDTKKFSEVLGAGYDAIVCAYGPSLDNLDKVYLQCVESHGRIKEALLVSDHQGAFIVIGGAGSLHNNQGISFADEKDFPYAQWYIWPDQHLNYMFIRAKDHGSIAFSRMIWMFWWARNNVENPGFFSWLLRPFAWLALWQIKKLLTSDGPKGLITSSRIALRMWEGVRDKQWSFLSPPWLLRDKGVRTGEYTSCEDTPANPAYQALKDGIYNEDMAAAIVDEVESSKYAFKHWTCTGPIDVKGQPW